MPITTIKYSKHIVAFLDVLGFSEIVLESSRSKKTRSSIKEFYKHCDVRSFWAKRKPNLSNLSSMVMSDSILLSVPLSDPEDTQTLRSFFQAIATLQFNLAALNFWTRGAITYGDLDFREKEKFAVGPALVKAVHLEKIYAKYPRVIVDSDILNQAEFDTADDFIAEINNNAQYGPLFNWTPTLLTEEKDYLTKDIPLFIDFFNLSLNMPHHKTQITQHVRNSLKKDIAHYSKYRWLADYICQSKRNTHAAGTWGDSELDGLR